MKESMLSFQISRKYLKSFMISPVKYYFWRFRYMITML